MIPWPGLSHNNFFRKASLLRVRQETTRAWGGQAFGSLSHSLSQLPLANFGLAAAVFSIVIAGLLVLGVVGFQLSYGGRIYPGVHALGCLSAG
jgi:hypothetical protein